MKWTFQKKWKSAPASSAAVETLPPSPENLSFDEVKLRFVEVTPGDAKKGLVPSYHFRIVFAGGLDVGHINLRVGDTEHVRLCAGHIGYEVEKRFRGRRFALQACRALAPFVRSVYETVLITCDPDNEPSRRTIENLGAEFVDEVDVPRDDPHYARGSRRKRRYRWKP